MRREIGALKMCDHPNIIKLLDSFETSDNFYLVFEYMEGKDLYDYLASRNHFLVEQKAMRLFNQIAQGVEYLHKLGIVHRDLKPENIIMSSNEDSAIPKITDFGLACFVGPDQYLN